MVTHEEKAQCVFQYFNDRLGAQQARAVTVDWNQFELTRHDLQHLEAEFTEDELNATVPDGFIGSFYKASWDIIRDLLAAANYFYSTMISTSICLTMHILCCCLKKRMHQQWEILDPSACPIALPKLFQRCWLPGCLLI